MKRLLLLSLFFLIIYTSKAQTNIQDKQAIETIKEFYTAHCKIWAVKPPLPPKIFNRKLDSLQNKYCTQKLIKEAKKGYDNVGYDLFTGDWGIDVESLKNMTIEKDATNVDDYIVSYVVVAYPQSPTKPVKEHVVLHVTVVKINGVLKLSSIKDSTKREV